jgi:hypothetical protein
VPDEAISRPVWGLLRRKVRGSQRHNTFSFLSITQVINVPLPYPFSIGIFRP